MYRLAEDNGTVPLFWLTCNKPLKFRTLAQVQAAGRGWALLQMILQRMPMRSRANTKKSDNVFRYRVYAQRYIDLAGTQDALCPPHPPTVSLPPHHHPSPPPHPHTYFPVPLPSDANAASGTARVFGRELPSSRTKSRLRHTDSTHTPNIITVILQCSYLHQVRRALQLRCLATGIIVVVPF